jgi:putrescine transport system substrate-binding protein
VLSALLCGALAACPGHGPGSPVSADEEKVLHIYNWDDYIAPDTIAQFERTTGIQVVYDLFDSNETLEGKLMVGDSGYDLVSTSMAWYSRQIRSGLYEPLDKRELPNWKNLDPAVLAVQAQADPGNRYAAPYLHAMNGFAYNVEAIRARMADAPLDSLDMLFRREVVSRFADCGVSFLDSPDDVLQLALKYLKIDPNSRRPEDLKAAEQLVMTVRPYIRLFDSNDYVNQLASRELCLAMAWSSDYSLAVVRSHAAGLDLHLAFTVPREGSNITYNAFLIPAGAPQPHIASSTSCSMRMSSPPLPTTRTTVTTTSRHGRSSAARSSTIRRSIRRPRCARGCTCRPSSTAAISGCGPAPGRGSRTGSSIATCEPSQPLPPRI